MVRHRLHFVVALGRYNEGVQWVREMNEACRKSGCVEGRLWAIGFGNTNECVLEYEYPDIATMDSDVTKFQSTAETMAIFRRGTQVRAPEHWPWDELLVEAPLLA
ncbi:MAG: hypothetical protein E6I33_03540 [Chloroflexi bacterium]|nr:MAG: hypothetical protein E6I33_03540 [Chloroflexota bacterium]